MGHLIVQEALIGQNKFQDIERDTYSCVHCSAVVIKNLGRVRDRAWCFKCNAVICDACSALPCTPLKQLIEQQLRKQAQLSLITKI
jgi:hypothetical protein